MPLVLVIEDVQAIVDEIAEAIGDAELVAVPNVDEALGIATSQALCLVLVDPLTVGNRVADLVFALPHGVPIVLLPTAYHVAHPAGVHERKLAAALTIRRLVEQHCGSPGGVTFAA